MRTIKPLANTLLALLLLALTSPLLAEQSTDFGDIVVHYNAVNSDFFDPEIAKLYGIKRSKNRALLTVTVLRKHMGLAAQPVQARVRANAVNLSNQIKSLDMREIKESSAIYYIAEFPITNRETLDFTIEVEPEGGRVETVKFRQQFFTR